MNRLMVVVLLGVSLAGCGESESQPSGAAPSPDLQVHVSLASTTLRPGEGVSLTVRRVWPKHFDPAPFDDALLAPFVLRAARVVLREDATRVEETRHYRAYAFSLEDVVIPALVFAAREPDGETLRLARSEPVAVTIRPVLDPQNPGPPEGPGHRAVPAAAWSWLLVLALLVLGFEALALRARRARAHGLLAQREAPLRHLRALQAASSSDPAACRADLGAAFEALRRDLATRGEVPARTQTTEEITAALTGARRDAWRRLARAAQIDRVKFADAMVAPEVLADVVAQAILFVRGDAEGARS